MATLNKYSPYRFCVETADSDGRRFMTEREPFGYVDLADNVPHLVAEGDTWHGLAYHYFRPLKLRDKNGVEVEVSSLLGHVIRDFQPVPILDPFIPPTPGSYLYVPSRRTLLNKIYSPDRRRFS